MDFFEHQDRARSNSVRLLFLFGLALAAIFAALYVLASLVHIWGEGEFPTGARPPGWFDPWRMALTAAFTGLLVGGGSALRISQLRAGGRSVAESLDGRLLLRGQGGLAEQRLLNVVEELAIAAGCPVPQVYVLEGEAGINAFAAGLTAGDAVIGVTRGALESLDRDQLRGVIGHEFSHILNGDMRLNVRLIGLLYGILCLSLFGRSLLQTRRGGFVVRSRRQGDNPLAILALGLLLIGSIGVFFGRLIQAAVSRQRELLADASAAQFTRDPEALAGALEAIARQGSVLAHPRSGEVAHMLLGAGRAAGWLTGWFATHPPIEERISRLRSRPFAPRAREALAAVGAALSAAAPAPGGGATVPGSRPAAAQPVGRSERPQLAALVGAAAPAAGGRPARPSPAGAQISAAAGALDPEALALSRELLAALPEGLRRASAEPFGARALALGLVLGGGAGAGPSGPLAGVDAALERELTRLGPDIRRLPAELALPLFELCLPALKSCSKAQYLELKRLLFASTDLDGERSPFELALRALLVARLDPHFGRAALELPGRRTLAELAAPATRILSLFAALGGSEGRGHAGVLAQALEGLGLPPAAPAPRRELLAGFESDLTQLQALAPLEKQRLLAALWTEVQRDGRVEIAEGECLRAASERLGVPLSPRLTRLGVAPAGNPLEGADG